MLWKLINIWKHLIFLEEKSSNLFVCVKLQSRELKSVIESFTSESTLCSRKYLPIQVSTTVLRRQDAFNSVLNLCVLWPWNYPTTLVFTRLITPALKWGNSYLNTGHLWRSYFLMMCGMKWLWFLLFSSHEK